MLFLTKLNCLIIFLCLVFSNDAVKFQDNLSDHTFPVSLGKTASEADGDGACTSRDSGTQAYHNIIGCDLRESAKETIFFFRIKEVNTTGLKLQTESNQQPPTQQGDVIDYKDPSKETIFYQLLVLCLK